jgi:NAD+ diphosphatase
MIQDIEPHKYNSTYGKFEVRSNDYIVAFKENKAILIKDGNEKRIPKYKEVMGVLDGLEHLIYMKKGFSWR